MTISKPESKPKAKFRDPLVIIGAFKLLKALSLVALAFGLFKLMHGDRELNLTHIVEHLRLDPHSEHLHHLIEKLTGVSAGKLKLIGVGTLVYAALYATEGVGLVLKKKWAEYLTTIGTTLLVPVEVYEMFHHFTVLRLVVLVLNLAIVAYLVYRLRRDSAKHQAKASAGLGASDVVAGTARGAGSASGPG